MKKIDDDWSVDSQPLIKGPGQEEINIYSKRCDLCGKQVRVFNNQMANHQCINKDGKQFGYGA